MKIRGVQALKNIGYMYMAQVAQMLLSVTMSIYVPMIVGLTEFSYWQLFIFYSTYVGLLHLGLNDGVYLKYGGKVLSNEEKRLVSSQLWMSMSIQMFILLFLFVVLIYSSPSKERITVFGLVLVFAVVNNIFNFCGSTLQALNKIKIYSMSVVADKLFVVASIVSLTIWGIRCFQVLICCDIVGRTIASLILLLRNKDIFLCRLTFNKSVLKEIATNIGFGCNLMIANIASTLIIGVGRFFIDMNYPVETFGIISFAFTMIGFALVLVSQVGNSVFPILKARGDVFLIEIYPRLNRLLSALLPFVFLAYPILVLFIRRFLPQYDESLAYFVFLLPMCIFEVKNTMLYNTFMKVLRKEQMLLCFNLVSLALSFLMSIISIYIFDSLQLLVIGLVLSVVIKAFLLHIYLCKTLHLSIYSNLIISDLIVGFACVIFLSIEWPFAQLTLGTVIILTLYAVTKAKVIPQEIKELFILRKT